MNAVILLATMAILEPGPAEIQAPPPTPPPVCRDGVVVGLNSWPVLEELAIREAPGQDAIQVGGMFNGAMVRVCGRSGSWGLVEFCSSDPEPRCAVGWSSLNFIRPVNRMITE